MQQLPAFCLGLVCVWCAFSLHLNKNKINQDLKENAEIISRKIREVTLKIKN